MIKDLEGPDWSLVNESLSGITSYKIISIYSFINLGSGKGVRVKSMFCHLLAVWT